MIVDVRNREELEGMTQSVRVQLEFLTEHMHKVSNLSDGSAELMYQLFLISECVCVCV